MKPIQTCKYCNSEHDYRTHDFQSCDECRSLLCEECQKLEEVKTTHGIHVFEWIYECPVCKE